MLSVLCHFQGGSKPERPRTAVALPPEADLLAPLLTRLVGQEVAVLAGGRIYAGKLIAAAPVTLVAADGRVSLVTERAVSVQF